jgi:hypothetical protein
MEFAGCDVEKAVVESDGEYLAIGRVMRAMHIAEKEMAGVVYFDFICRKLYGADEL